MAKILLIEDDLRTSHGVRELLECLGHEVHPCSNGKEAVQVWDREAPDLVLTDILMPDMDGIEVLLASRERSGNLPVIAMSGEVEAPYLDSARLLGACTVLKKPFGVGELEEALKVALDLNPSPRAVPPSVPPKLP